MKPIMHGVAALLIAGFSLGYALDDNPINALGTQTRNALGSATEAPQENPALLGVDRVPRSGLMIAPISNFGVGLWSDKLALSPLIEYWKANSGDTGVSRTLSKVLTNSFNLSGMTPQQVSDKLTSELAGGVTIYAGAKATLASFAQNRIAFDITTRVEQQTHLPDGPLFAVFSTNKGLQVGNTLDFSNIRSDALWTTDFTFNIGLPVTVPALNDFFKLRYGAGGLGVKYVMGHSIFHAQADNGKLTYDQASNSWIADGNLTVQTAGAGLKGYWDYSNPFKNSVLPPITGHGIGIDLGGILYDETGSMTINVKDLGVIFWLSNVQTVTYKVHTSGMNVDDIVTAIDSFGANPRGITRLFQKQGGFISDSTNDSLVNGNGFATMLPLRLDIGYARTFDLSKSNVPYLAKYANVSADYDQGFTNQPGNSLIPRVSIGAEAGALYGYLPIRMGFVLGGQELFASALGAGLNFKYFSLNAAYKAVGTMYFVPSHGVELAAGMGFNWGMTLPPKYVVVPEYDRDHDGIPDSVDRCPDVAEDKDGFEDADGCPDYDNDADGIPDSLDQCPNLPGTRENEGCPVFDQDKDGIPDSLDKCPKESENYNGYMDEDGCPDTLMKPDTLKPTVKEMEVLNTKLRDINFKTASAELLPVSFAALDYVVTFLHQYPNLRYEIQGHTDSRGGDDYNLLLSAARAASVRTYLLTKGISDSSLIAIGYGKTKPIATNNTAAGRALNRRVEFRYIQEASEYSALKVQESMFQEKIREAKLKGAKY